MKNWFQSKTIWINLITTVILSLEAVKAVDLLSTEQMVYLGLFVTILNIVLRVWFTDMGIRK